MKTQKQMEVTLNDQTINSAIGHAINPAKDANGYLCNAVSDGEMVMGYSDAGVAVAFNNTAHNQNQLLVLRQADAKALFALLYSVGKTKGWIV